MNTGLCEPLETSIPGLGPANIPSPVREPEEDHHNRGFVSDDDRIVVDLNIANLVSTIESGKLQTKIEKVDLILFAEGFKI